MADRAKTARAAREIRHIRLRKKLSGTAGRPRLSVFRSLNHIYAQVVDDERGHTLTSASSLDPEVRRPGARKSKGETAKLVGGLLARRATEQGVTSVVFDRAGYQYHGRVRVLAEAAREGGLLF